MSGNQTKILIAVILGFVFILSGYGVYRYLTKQKTVETAPSAEETGAFPESGRVTPAEEISNGESTRGAGQAARPTGTPGAGAETQGTITGALDIKVVSARPVAGGVFIEKEDPDSPIKSRKLYVRYMERESGHIFELAYNENRPDKISNTTITRIHDAYFNNTNNSILLRRLNENNDIQNIYALFEEKAPTTSPAALIEAVVGKLNQSLLPSGIKEVAISPNKNKIFYLTAIGADFIGTTEDFSGKPGLNKKQVFSSPLSEWLIQWPEANTIFFNTKPSARVPGFLFSQTLNKTGLTRILSNINGLTTSVSPNLKKIVYSESVERGLKTYIYDVASRERSLLPLVTLPEKCVWGGVDQEILYCAAPSNLQAGEYPDSWYQGVVSFDDEIWKIDIKTGSAELLADKVILGRNGGVDATNLTLSPDENHLLLTNKKDSSLWQIKIR